MKEKLEKGARIKACIHMLIAIYGALCLWLYYHQSIAILPESGNGVYQSDLPLHLSMVLEDGWYYSFTAFVYQFLDIVCMGSTWGVALFLCVVTILTVYATDLLLEEFGLVEASWQRLLLALSLNFVMPIFIPSVGEFRYVSYQSGNIWHNSTYLCMRLFAILCLIAYFRLERSYRDGLSLKEWLIFAVLNVICTGIKPSFLVAYSPIVGVFLLIDLIKGVPFKRIFAFGAALLPSGLVILWQNMVLFGQDTGSSILIGPWVNFSQHTNIPKVAVVLSVLFCVLTFAYVMISYLVKHGKNTLKDWNFSQVKPEVFVLGMTAMSFLEALLFVESGYRAAAGNFLWGYFFSIFVLFIVSSKYWLSLGRTKGEMVCKWGLGLIYAWHLYCGIYFFAMLVSGVGYFM